MRRQPHISAVFSLLFLAFGLTASAAVTETPSATDYSSHVFTEIELNADGVTALDTLGAVWVYDFEKDQFVPEEIAQAGSGDAGEEGTGRVAPPVEERCTEELTVETSQNTVLVGYDEYVDGDIIAYGRVTVKGWVKGSVRSLSGRVIIASSGQVDGDVRAPEIDNRGGTVKGSQTITKPFAEFITNVLKDSFSVDGLIVVSVFFLVLLIAGFLIVSLFPRQLIVYQRTLIKHPVRTVLVGFLFVMLSPVVIALVAITIVGVIIIPLVPVLYLMCAVFGVVAASTLAGRWLVSKLLKAERPAIFETLAGIIAIMSLWFLAALLMGSPDSLANGFGIFFLNIAALVTLYPVLGGIGAGVMTRFGNREYVPRRQRYEQPMREAPAPAPPPIPEVPTMPSPGPIPNRMRPDIPPTGPLSRE